MSSIQAAIDTVAPVLNAAAESRAIVLSTMTLDGQITNVKFDKVTAIQHLRLTDRVVEIGCNFGYKILDDYKTWPCYKDRMSKKQRRVEQSSRRKQGLGTHFNSQITFTIVTEHDASNSYQVKLFTNGRIQIPGIGKLSKDNDELLEDILSVICSYVIDYPQVLMLNPRNPVDVAYLMPILQNYKSRTLMADDCMMERRIIVEDGRRFEIIPNIDLAAFERVILDFKTHNRTPIPIDTISFNPERYAGMLIKFSTPVVVTGRYWLDKFIEIAKLIYYKRARRSRAQNPPTMYRDYVPDMCSCDGECGEHCFRTRKMMRVVRQMQFYWYCNGKSSKRFRGKVTTVKLFRSGRINLDHVNNMEQAHIIRGFIVRMIMAHWSDVIYYDE